MTKLAVLYTVVVAFGVVVLVVDSVKAPLLLIGLFVFVASHELGHALATSWFGAFRGFTIHNGNPSTVFEDSLIPKSLLPITLASGMIANLMLTPIVLPLLSDLKVTVIQYVLLVLLFGAGDILCIIRGKPFREKA